MGQADDHHVQAVQVKDQVLNLLTSSSKPPGGKIKLNQTSFEFRIQFTWRELQFQEPCCHAVHLGVLEYPEDLGVHHKVNEQEALF